VISGARESTTPAWSASAGCCSSAADVGALIWEGIDGASAATVAVAIDA
jgi:hypothetical protein